MRCDACGNLFRYKGIVVALCDTDGALAARLVCENTPGSGEADRLGAHAKFHKDCYDSARQADPSLPVFSPSIRPAGASG
jgi:hypothetical protein